MLFLGCALVLLGSSLVFISLIGFLCSGWGSSICSLLFLLFFVLGVVCLVLVLGFACLLVSRSRGGYFVLVFGFGEGAGVSQVGQIA